MDDDARKARDFPLSSGLFFGLGLGGFFDGILLHQVLQWHHMLTSAGYPATDVHNLEVNTLWDGLFHLSWFFRRFRAMWLDDCPPSIFKGYTEPIFLV
jgi:uncharacterized membrane protein